MKHPVGIISLYQWQHLILSVRYTLEVSHQHIYNWAEQLQKSCQWNLITVSPSMRSDSYKLLCEAKITQ